MNGAMQVPLTELLRNVPDNARLLVVGPEPFSSSTSHPVGSLCHQAADRIAELEALLRDAKEKVLMGLSTKVVIELTERAERAEAERDALLACIQRLPPYDDDGFYIDHGEQGKQAVSVRDVIDSFRAAIDAARKKT